VYNKKIAFGAACLGMLIFGITIVTLGSLANELKEKFSLDNYSSGTLFSILPIGLLAGSLIFGPIADRYGFKHLLSAAMVGVFIGFEGIAYANDLNLLRASIFLFGFCGGVINGAANAVVVDVSDTHKGPNLQILGIFFGLGALGMPLLMGLLIRSVAPLQVLAAVGVITLLAGIAYQFITFPPAKHGASVLDVEWRQLLKPILLLIAFFLFFQSSLESIITNWTTTYIGSKKVMSEGDALFGLSIHMIGMVTARIITGTWLRSMAQTRILWQCLLLLAVGIRLLQTGSDPITVYGGLFLAGAGLSGGFPVMLGFVGQFFASMSGTAISFVFVIALSGNMLINYLTGALIQRYGIDNLVFICYAEIMFMFILFYFITRKLK
jgi:MFS family permease